MSIVTGIDAIRAAAKDKGGTGKGRNDTFLKLQDGDVKKVRFLQELDESSPNYNEELGLGALVVEYRDPDDFRKRALDTTESEGKCWMAEQGWRPRVSFYINVLDEETGKVHVLNQGFGPKTITEWLLEYAGDAGSITNVPFKIRRKGSGQYDTEYTLTPAGVPGDPVEIDPEKLVDIDTLLNHVPYEEQEEFFRGEQASDKKSGSESIW